MCKIEPGMEGSGRWFTKRFLVDLQVARRKAAEDDFVNAGKTLQCRADCGDGYLGRKIDRVAIDACADAGECQRRNAVRARKFHGAAIARCQQFRLAVHATAPDWANGVNDVLGGQPVARGEFCLAGLAASQETALVEQVRSGGTMNRTINATATEERRVRSIDDRVDGERGDVGLKRADGRCHRRGRLSV